MSPFWTPSKPFVHVDAASRVQTLKTIVDRRITMGEESGGGRGGEGGGGETKEKKLVAGTSVRTTAFIPICGYGNA